VFGSTSVDQLRENVGALEVLARHEAGEIRAAVAGLWDPVAARRFGMTDKM
jgi:hypothetical protein